MTVIFKPAEIRNEHYEYYLSGEHHLIPANLLPKLKEWKEARDKDQRLAAVVKKASKDE